MVNSWPDGVRPVRRRWPGAEDLDPEGGYTPVGLEGWRPEEPAAGIGLSVKPPGQEPFEAFARSWLMPPEERTEISWPTRQVPESMLTRVGELRAHEGPSASGVDDLRTWGPRGNSSSEAAADPDAGPKVAFAPIGTAHTALTGFANVAPSGSLGFFMSGVAAKPITESVSSQVAKAATSAGATAARAVLAGASSIGTAAPILLSPFNPGPDALDLGNGYRLRTAPGQRTAEIQQGDDGVLGTGLLRSWRNAPVDAQVVVNPGGIRDIQVDWDRFEKLFGPKSASEARQQVEAALGRPANAQPGTTPLSQGIGGAGQLPILPMADPREGPVEGERQVVTAADRPEIGDPALPPDTKRARGDWERTAKWIQREFPGFMPRSMGHWSLEGVELTDAEREGEQNCKSIQKKRGSPAPDSEYTGDDGVDTVAGIRIAPRIGEIGATTRPSDPRHEKGLMGEIAAANRAYNQSPDTWFPHVGNPPGMNGPDGITISNAHRHLMLLESKYSTEPRSVGPSAAAKASGPSRYVLDNLKKARDAGRIPEDVIDDALAKYTNGDYSACFVGTGNAHNGYIIHYRNHTPVILKRFER